MKFNGYIGDRHFYKKVLAVAVPIMLQSGISSLVNLLDNVMIGRLGTEAMSGVSIVNEFIFVFNMIIFGAGAAAGIFTSQYHGAGDVQGVRGTFRIKIVINLSLCALTVLILSFFGREVISLFLHSGGSDSDPAVVLSYGMEYLAIMTVGLVPYAISQAYSTTLRETDEAVLPTYSGIVAMVTNFILNLVLIYGLLGFPALGVRGAAIASVISRFAELLYLVIRVHGNTHKYPFIKGALTTFAVSGKLIRSVAVRGMPLMMNELLWSFAMTFRNQCISTAGLDAVAAMNIQNTMFNVLNITYAALANSIAIIVGNLLGAGKMEEAKDTDKKLLVFSVLCGGMMCLLQMALSPLFPVFYNTSGTVRSLATYMLIISAVSMPLNSLAMACYYTLRSGGLAMLTMLFDCVYAWVITVPVAFVLAYFTDVGIHLLFAAVILAESLKCILGLILVKRVRWARRLT